MHCGGVRCICFSAGLTTEAASLDHPNPTHPALQAMCRHLDLPFNGINASMVAHQLNMATVGAACRLFAASLQWLPLRQRQLSMAMAGAACPQDAFWLYCCSAGCACFLLPLPRSPPVRQRQLSVASVDEEDQTPRWRRQPCRLPFWLVRVGMRASAWPHGPCC